MIRWLLTLIERWRIRRAMIDVRAKCPFCGWMVTHKVRVMHGQVGNGAPKFYIEHTCAICAGIFYQDTVRGEQSKWIATESTQAPAKT